MAIVLPLVAAGIAQAHFVFVVPAADGASVRVLLSETLEPDGEVPIAFIKSTKLALRDAAGQDAPLPLKKTADNAFVVPTAGNGLRVVHGILDLGVNARGGGQPHLLIYYPKAILGNPFDERTVLGAERPVELIPVGEPGAVRLRLVALGKPVAKSAVTVLLPSGDQQEVETDAEGLTPALTERGRIGAWARHWEDTAGEIGGKKFEQIRRYATIVFDVPSDEQAVVTSTKTAEATPAEATAPAALELTSDKLPKLPQAASSLGGAAAGGYAYVYGGHIVRPHLYHTEAVTGEFHRLNLADPTAWEKLPGGTPLQGLNIVEAGGRIYRIGGMHPINKKGDPTDNRSVAECAVYDPASGVWAEFPPLTAPRSSHDVVAVGDRLIVVGGWDMRGEEGEIWCDTIETIDLSAEKLAWQTSPQPLQRRALIAAVHNGKVYVIGGFQESTVPSLEVDIYDPQAGTWAKGPELPGKEFNGFAPAACVHKGELYASVADGSLLRLSDDATAWNLVGKTNPRIVHRMISYGNQLLLLGGASRGGNVDVVEAVTVR